MGRMPWATYLWPGLPQLWKRGTWTALCVAVGAALALNVAVAGSLVWSELFPPAMRRISLVAVALFWAGSAVYSLIWDRADWPPRCAAPTDDAYPSALGHYLKGNWFEAERLLDQMLKQNARDLDAGLLLATLWRHTGRIEEAIAQLDRLQLFEGNQKWELEIARERQLLAAARKDGTADDQSASDKMTATSAA
jgi:hypothetical protein